MLVITNMADIALADVQVRQNAQGETLQVTGLSDTNGLGWLSDGGASCTKARFSGKVIKREFHEDAVRIASFVFEQEDGVRQSVNVFIPNNLDLRLLGLTMQSLQRFLREGRSIGGVIRVCSGDVYILDEIF